MISFKPLPFYTRGNIPRYPLNKRLGGPQSQYGHYAEAKILKLSHEKKSIIGYNGK
jgi:hypothetical protein